MKKRLCETRSSAHRLGMLCVVHRILCPVSCVLCHAIRVEFQVQVVLVSRQTVVRECSGRAALLMLQYRTVGPESELRCTDAPFALDRCNLPLQRTTQRPIRQHQQLEGGRTRGTCTLHDPEQGSQTRKNPLGRTL